MLAWQGARMTSTSIRRSPQEAQRVSVLRAGLRRPNQRFVGLIWVGAFWKKAIDSMEHRAGIEPASTGFADQRVSHFATGALDGPGELSRRSKLQSGIPISGRPPNPSSRDTTSPLSNLRRPRLYAWPHRRP
jgi:hypothetical protein